MTLKFVVALFGLYFCPTLLACRWANDWDGPLNFECGSDQFVSHIESDHRNDKEDRRYKMCCRQTPRYVKFETTRCHWTDYLNNYDEFLTFTCGNSGYINGFKSIHSNHHEDRKWKIRCCTVQGLYLPSHEFTFTGWTNNWDGHQDFTTQHNHITAGVWSEHSNHHEDRRWNYLVCRPSRSTLTNILQRQNDTSLYVEQN
ncbi:hemagglutinin/amebocyte aggregation factor-like [Ruditapes philippinarum]|uniref:hemagglutinin/amebocyte aggregation factor-like n=1 Tax=Ruditapes philippinarum TaxID=129788 RepID=UPI00295A7C64|nr:hemagglutinin/amebocyte aggregation factor-like [Ruditapes philippinarum]